MSQAKSTPPDNWEELKAKYEAEIEALQDTTEMATVDKEIAEEKLDACEKELLETKDLLVEAASQLEALKENQSQADTSSVSDSAATVYQLRKVEEQNEILKQALLKLRDISTNDKKALEEMQLEYEELKVRAAMFEEKENLYLEQVKALEEQVDLGAGAQEMVEKLSQEKTDLEDKVKNLQEDLDEMEKLRDINNQILESIRENEVELTSEVERVKMQFSELLKSKLGLEKYISELESAIGQMKEMNKHLSEEVQSLLGQNVEQQRHGIENAAYKLNFSESKMAEKDAELARYKRNLAAMNEQMESLSQLTKAQESHIREQKMNLESQIVANNDLKKMLRQKIEDIDELDLRHKLIEKKLECLQVEKESKLAELTMKLEQMKGREIEYQELLKRREESACATAMDIEEDSHAHQNFLNIQLQSTPRLQPLTTTTQILPSIPASLTTHQDDSLKSHEESILETKVRDLRRAFDLVNRRNYELELTLARQTMDKKASIILRPVVKSSYNLDTIKDLRQRIDKLKREAQLAITTDVVYKNSRNVMSKIRRDKFEQSKFAFKYVRLHNELHALTSNATF